MKRRFEQLCAADEGNEETLSLWGLGTGWIHCLGIGVIGLALEPLAWQTSQPGPQKGRDLRKTLVPVCEMYVSIGRWVYWYLPNDTNINLDRQ